MRSGVLGLLLALTVGTRRRSALDVHNYQNCNTCEQMFQELSTCEWPLEKPSSIVWHRIWASSLLGLVLMHRLIYVGLVWISLWKQCFRFFSLFTNFSQWSNLHSSHAAGNSLLCFTCWMIKVWVITLLSRLFTLSEGSQTSLPPGKKIQSTECQTKTGGCACLYIRCRNKAFRHRIKVRRMKPPDPRLTTNVKKKCWEEGCEI